MTSIFSRFFLATAVFSLALSSCSSKDETSSELAKTYFYPGKADTYVMIFQDSLNPIFEMFERVSTFKDPWGEHRIIERYNSNFTLVESYDVLADENAKVLKHTLYHGPREISAKITDSTFMPWKGKANFSSSFPGSVDSIYFTLTNKRSLNKEPGSFLWRNQKVETRIFTDSIFTLAIDLKNQREKTQSTVAYHEFAKGLGRVRIKSADGKLNLVLIEIMTDQEWKTLITK